MNYETSIYEGEKHGRLPKNYETLIYDGKKYGNLPK